MGKKVTYLDKIQFNKNIEGESKSFTLKPPYGTDGYTIKIDYTEGEIAVTTNTQDSENLIISPVYGDLGDFEVGVVIRQDGCGSLRYAVPVSKIEEVVDTPKQGDDTGGDDTPKQGDDTGGDDTPKQGDDTGGDDTPKTPTTYTITTQGYNATITEGGVVESGGSFTFTATANEGYQISVIYVNGSETLLDEDNTCTITNITEDTTIEVYAIPLTDDDEVTSYVVEFVVEKNNEHVAYTNILEILQDTEGLGYIEVREGDNATINYSITDEIHKIDSVSIDGAIIENTGTISLTNVQADRTIRFVISEIVTEDDNTGEGDEDNDETPLTD